MKNKRIHIEANNNRKNAIQSKEGSVLIESARIASSKAIRSYMALGITIKIIRDYEIIAVNLDAAEKVLRKIQNLQLIYHL